MLTNELTQIAKNLNIQFKDDPVTLECAMQSIAAGLAQTIEEDGIRAKPESPMGIVYWSIRKNAMKTMRKAIKEA
jgi:hypothetical protein